MGLRLHPRYFMVRDAEAAFTDKLIKWEEDYPDLTSLEIAKILQFAQGRILTYALRVERHPDDPSKKGDEA